MNIKKYLIDKIKKNGSLNVAEFIKICQFENSGYYPTFENRLDTIQFLSTDCIMTKF